MATQETVCNNCGGSGCIANIILAGRAITVLGRGLDQATAQGPVTLCCRCSLPAVSAGYFGSYPHCKSCLEKSRHDISRPGLCVRCGVQCTPKSMWTEVVLPGGGVGMAWFCRMHVGECPDRPVSQEQLDSIHGDGQHI